MRFTYAPQRPRAPESGLVGAVRSLLQRAPSCGLNPPNSGNVRAGVTPHDVKGVVFNEFIDMVETQFSLGLTNAMLERANVPSGGAYAAVGTYDRPR